MGLESEYSSEFDKLRKNRVEVSYYKYGAAQKNFGEGRVDAIATAELCIEAFKKDHNTEHLVDAANYLMSVICTKCQENISKEQIQVLEP